MASQTHLSIIRALRQILSNWRWLFLLLVGVIIPSSIALPIGLENLGWMRVGPSTPWGVVLGIFVHKDLAHYGWNMAFILLFGVVFVLLNLYFDEVEQRRRASLFAGTVRGNEATRVTQKAL